MKAARRVYLVLLVLAMMSSVVIAGYLASITPQRQKGRVYPHINHLPISIDEPSEFTPPNANTGCACVVAGSGTSTSPYVIAGWEIDASQDDGISIRHIDRYFTISQVKVWGTRMHAAISLEMVQNAEVSNSEIIGTFTAISLLQSRNVVIVDNVISNATYGVVLEASSSNTVVGNTIDGIAQISIFVRGSDNLIEDNAVEGSYGGINIDGTPGPAERNSVKNNMIRQVEAYGIGLWRALGNTIDGNIVTEGGGQGILLTDSSSNNTIQNNNVTDNSGDGIVIAEESSNNLVQRNAVTGNGDGINTFDLHSAVPNNIWRDNIFRTREPDTLR